MYKHAKISDVLGFTAPLLMRANRSGEMCWIGASQPVAWSTSMLATSEDQQGRMGASKLASRSSVAAHKSRMVCEAFVINSILHHTFEYTNSNISSTAAQKYAVSIHIRRHCGRRTGWPCTCTCSSSSWHKIYCLRSQGSTFEHRWSRNAVTQRPEGSR